MRRLVLSLVVFAACAGLRGAPIERDLGLGLAYWRIHSLPEDLPPAHRGAGHPWVIDIRFVRGGTRAGAALFGWLKSTAGQSSPVFLLANTQTSGEILAPLDSPDAVPGLVILGPSAKDFQPDIALPVDPKTDRRAYDALEKGAPISALLVDSRDKPRNDEARLEREHLPDTSLDEDDSGEPPTPSKAPPLMDLVLLRAVHLHRALLALKRL